jgi:hypothetical protein
LQTIHRNHHSIHHKQLTAETYEIGQFIAGEIHWKNFTAEKNTKTDQFTTQLVSRKQFTASQFTAEPFTIHKMGNLT